MANLDTHYIKRRPWILWQREQIPRSPPTLRSLLGEVIQEEPIFLGWCSCVLGGLKKVKKVLNNLTNTAGITVVEQSWESIQIALSGFDISMKKVYLESYENMQSALHCHLDELNTVCSECFHFLVSEFIEMIMGLNELRHSFPVSCFTHFPFPVVTERRLRSFVSCLHKKNKTDASVFKTSASLSVFNRKNRSKPLICKQTFHGLELIFKKEIVRLTGSTRQPTPTAYSY